MKLRLLKNISLIAAGFILGAALTNLFIGIQLDYFYLANKSLANQLVESKNELDKLKESRDARSKHIINAVEIFLTTDTREKLTDYDQLALEVEASNQVKDWLSSIIGTDVSEIDTLLIPQIVDNRTIEANGNKYRLNTHLVVINRTTSVYLKASVIKDPGQE